MALSGAKQRYKDFLYVLDFKIRPLKLTQLGDVAMSWHTICQDNSGK